MKTIRNPGKLCLAITMIVLFSSMLEASTYIPIFRADFWIKRLDDPDRQILSQEQIKELNRAILAGDDEMAEVQNMEGAVPKESLVEWLLKDPLPQDKKMFDKRGKEIKEAFYNQLLDNMQIEAVQESNELLFGMVTKRIDIRAFPTDEPVLKDPSARDFDAFQYSAIYPPQPVALLHKSRDGKWGFFQTPFVRGWIKMADIAFAYSRDEINQARNKELNPSNGAMTTSAESSDDVAVAIEKNLVITGNKVRVFADRRRGKALESLPMGRRVAITGEDKNFWVVRFPQKGKDGYLEWTDAYIEKKSDVHIGSLPYTKRNVISQAFKILGERYGWGGRDGLRDCSSFIKDVFATMGINLPRHSSHQASVGTVLVGLDESAAPETIKNAMDSSIPGITLFGLNGHIMLYLGNVNGSYYTLHQLFGYYDKDGFRTINKAVVTNLELGKDSKMGPIRDRVKSVNLITLGESN